MARVALVTGGSRGIGEAISKALKAEGYQVAATYAGNDEKAAAFTEATGIKTYKWNVADYEASKAGLAQVEAELGPIDIVVANAGITRDAPFHKMTPEMWNEVIDTNLTGVFNTVHPIWPGMRDRGFGRIIVISSINGQKGQMGQVNYAATKAGDLGIIKSLAQEGARRHHGECHLPRLYCDRNGHGRAGKGPREHYWPDPRGSPGRAGRDRALRGVPCVGRFGLHQRVDHFGQRGAILRLSATPRDGGWGEVPSEGWDKRHPRTRHRKTPASGRFFSFGPVFRC